MKPLTGIRVLEFCQVLSGPFCGMLLADLGADVIKLERPPLGDSSRYNAPGRNGVSGSYAYRNKGKRSVLMDLADLKQRELFYKMVADADVVLENYKPGTLEKYNCGYEDLKKIKPDIILTSLSGFGQTGPNRNRAAYDTLIQAESGLLSVTGTKDGKTLTSVGYSITDTIAGYSAFGATLAALLGRAHTGEGAHVDVSMQDATLITMDQVYEKYYIDGEVAGPLGVGNPLAAPFSDYEVKGGGRLVICVTTEAQWEKFCRVLGLEELVGDPRFASRGLRKRNEDELNSYIVPRLKSMEEADVIAGLDRERVTYGHINTLADVVKSEHFKARNLQAYVTFPDREVSIPVTANSIKMTGMEDQREFIAYPLGWNTFEVLREYEDEAALHAIYDGVIAASAEAARDAEIKGGVRKP